VKALGLEQAVVDGTAFAHAVGRFRDAGILLPSFGELAEPAHISCDGASPGGGRDVMEAK